MEHMTPVFLCKSAEETRAFYEALGFTVTYWQDEPYFYGAVSRGEMNLHFAKGKGGGLCLVHVPQIEPYHQAFADGLREKYGRIPTADYPRITRLMPGQTRFGIYDPSGNELLFVNQDEPDIDYDAYDDSLSPLMQALENVAFLRDTYNNDKAAAKFLDKKLKQYASAEPIERARALAARAELAVAMGDVEESRAFREQLKALNLTNAEREQHRDTLQAADRLERWVTQADEDR